MGCVSSKLHKRNFREEEEEEEEIVFGNGDCNNHVVSLTSSTYGVLKLDKEIEKPVSKKRSSPPREEPPEVINAWELMEDLEEEIPGSVPAKKSPKSRVFIRGIGEIDARSPLKFFNQIASPKKLKRFGGKENRGGVNRWDFYNFSPKQALKSGNSMENLSKESPNLGISVKGSSSDVKSECSRVLKSGYFPENVLKESPNFGISGKGSSSVVKSDFSRVDSVVLSRRRGLSPLFDPELVASFEKQLSKGEEQIKEMIFETPVSRRERNSREYSNSILGHFDEKCPPGGENSVVIYTTTLRGIRKTFEDCNIVRSIIESHCVRMFERDVSMDSGLKEELRGIMGKKEVKVPMVLVKGRIIGGAEEVVRLEEEGKLGILLSGIPRAAGSTCLGCGGARFVMCVGCNGSCKVLDESGKKTMRCGKCNENGLIICPICC